MKETNCLNCDEKECPLYGQDLNLKQKCERCTFGTEPSGQNCGLCIGGYCGFIEKAET